MNEETTAHTGSEGHAEAHHEDLSTLTWPVVNFLVFLLVMVTVYKKKIQPALVGRAKSFQATVQRVEEEEREFQNQVESIRYQLAVIDDNERKVIEDFMNQGRLSAEAITKQGLSEISRLQSETAQTKVNLVNQLEEEVRSVITAKAMKLAADKLALALTPEMDKNLRAKVLQSIN